MHFEIIKCRGIRAFSKFRFG